MGAVDWQTDLRPSRVLFGAGSVAELGELVRELGGRRVLVVSDAGIRAAGHVQSALDSLERAQLDCKVFDHARENPTESDVAEGVVVAREAEPDFLVGLGGGSAMDCAKGINFVYTNGGKMADYEGMGKAAKPMLPSVGLPCTAGTGSEAQSFALISREDDHHKMACGDPKARFRAVILDPELAQTAPRQVAAATGLDALSHALESFVTTARNPYSQMFAKEAFGLLNADLETVLSGHAETEAWGRMLLGAHFAGSAIETSMLGAAHATANPLTAAFGITHGVAIALMLPGTLRFNGRVVERVYSRLRGNWENGQGSASNALALRIEELRRHAGVPDTLREHGVGEEALGELASQAATQWTAGFNPRPLSEGDALELYREVF